MKIKINANFRVTVKVFWGSSTSEKATSRHEILELRSYNHLAQHRKCRIFFTKITPPYCRAVILPDPRYQWRTKLENRNTAPPKSWEYSVKKEAIKPRTSVWKKMDFACWLGPWGRQGRRRSCPGGRGWGWPPAAQGYRARPLESSHSTRQTYQDKEKHT